MKKRIFIAIHYMEIGGAEISLVGLLNAIDYTRYDVDLFVYSHQGELMALIPKQVNLLPEVKSYAQIEQPMVDVCRRGYIHIVLARLWAKFKYSRYARRNSLSDGSAIFQYVFDAVAPFLPSLKKYGEYDLAISFLTPHNIVLDKVKAKKKIAWIHTDYSKISVNAERELKVWGRYDYIASISEDVTKTFLGVFPSLSSKIKQIHNILSPAFVRGRAAQEGTDGFIEDGSIKLLSVGRFSAQKNFDNVPDICKRIREKGCNVKWYLIGFGGDEPLIRSRIEEAGMKDYVVILGKKSNPYPYINSCDVYVQPSRFEGHSVTVREAQMLCKPVVVTNYATAKSQIKHGIDGMIVPQDNESCANGIVDFLKDRALQSSIVDYLCSHNYGNEEEVQKLYNLI